MNEILLQMIIYTSMVIAGAFLANALGGFASWKVLLVKLSGGKKVLLKIHGITGPYLTTGKLSGNEVRYKKRGSKEQSLLTIPQETYIKRWFNVPFIELNEQGKIVAHDFTIVSGNDPELIDNLYTRVLMLPKKPGLQEVIIYLAFGIIIIGLLYIGYTQHQMAETLKILVEAKTAVATGVVPVTPA